MRKTICTSSLFVALVGVIVASFTVEVPCQAFVFEWIYPHKTWCYGSSLLITWIVFNVAMPLSGVFLAGLGLAAIWQIAADICAKLRGDERKEPNEKH